VNRPGDQPHPPAADLTPESVRRDGPSERVGSTYIWLIVAAQFGVFIAPAPVRATGGEKNHILLYLVAAACTVAGGLVVLRIKSVK
jgi:hypothetical protein